MKRIVYVFVMLATLCCAPCGFAYQGALDGEVMVAPPRFSEPPEIVVVPSERYPNQYVYMVPQMEGVYVYQGMWYRYYRGIWFQASSYDAPWYPISLTVVPPLIISVPYNYALYLPGDYYRIHYWDYQRYWRSWDHDHHWHNHHWYRHEMRPEIRHERMRHISHQGDRDMRDRRPDNRHDRRYDRMPSDTSQRSRLPERPTTEQRVPDRNHLDGRTSERNQGDQRPIDTNPATHRMQTPHQQQSPMNIMRRDQLQTGPHQSQDRQLPPPTINQDARGQNNSGHFLRREQSQQLPQRDMRETRGNMQQMQSQQREGRGQMQQMPQRQIQQPAPQVKQQSPPPANQQQQQITPPPQERRTR